VAHQLPAACTGITASGACAPGGTASTPAVAAAPVPAPDTTSATGAQLAQQLTEQAAQLVAVQARLQAAEAARSRLERQLAEREAVIGQLARNRDNSTCACLPAVV
jgi:septal ring factor EnvC (AmiA/AmiB activator)